MKIADKTVVKMHYSVLDGEGNLIDSSYDAEPLEFIHGTKFLLDHWTITLIYHQMMQ